MPSGVTQEEQWGAVASGGDCGAQCLSPSREHPSVSAFLSSCSSASYPLPVPAPIHTCTLFAPAWGFFGCFGVLLSFLGVEQ